VDDQELLPLRSGHFGLTLLRASAFAKMPRPWFLGVPDENGGWGEGRTDDDIYFWRQWLAKGLSLCQANHVRVGHLQLVVSWPDRDLAPLHQYVSDYRANGIPDGVAKP
jgi:hypothetical protein